MFDGALDCRLLKRLFETLSASQKVDDGRIVEKGCVMSRPFRGQESMAAAGR